MGHWARECRKKKRDEAAHAAQAEEETEAALNLGMTSLEVEAVTEELLVPLGNEGSTTCARWVLEEEDLEPTPIVAHVCGGISRRRTPLQRHLRLWPRPSSPHQ